MYPDTGGAYNWGALIGQVGNVAGGLVNYYSGNNSTALVYPYSTYNYPVAQPVASSSTSSTSSSSIWIIVIVAIAAMFLMK